MSSQSPVNENKTDSKSASPEPPPPDVLQLRDDSTGRVSPSAEQLIESTATPSSSSPLQLDADFALIKEFVRKATNGSFQSNVASSRVKQELSELLMALTRLLVRFPSHEEAVLLACTTLPLCKDVLPSEPHPILSELQCNAFEALSGLDVCANRPLIEAAFRFTLTLWVCYPSSLPAACNVQQLAMLIKAALDSDQHSSSDKVHFLRDYVSFLMQVLSSSQLEALEREGVYASVRALLRNFDSMTADSFQHLVVCVGMFAELKDSSQAFRDDELYACLLFAAEKHHANSMLQQFIWSLLSLLCQQDHSFIATLIDEGLLAMVYSILKKEGSHLMPILRFLTLCAHKLPKVFVPSCLSSKELVEHFVTLIRPPSISSNEITSSICDFLAYLCSKCDLASSSTVLELSIVSTLEDCARKQPETCLLPACMAIEGMTNLFPPEQIIPLLVQKGAGVEQLLEGKAAFFSRDHHLFVQDMLGEAVVSGNPALLEMVYITVQKLLKSCTPEHMHKLDSKEFIEVFVISFIRDISMFPSLANRIVFTAHYFLFQIKDKDAIAHFRELEFHTAASDFLANAEAADAVFTTMGLLACLIGKYNEVLKDVKPFLNTQMPRAIITRAKEFSTAKRSQFGDDFSRILLNLTADKELSLDLHKQGFLDQLVGLLQESKFHSVIRKSVIHAIGNIALGGSNIKNELLDGDVSNLLVRTLAEKDGDAYLLSACCRVLHILASGDWAKQKFIKAGCVEILVDILKTRKETPEIQWRPLGLLSSLGFIPVFNRRLILTDEVVQAVVELLKSSTHAKVISYTTLVFLGSGELDEGVVKLRQLGVVQALREAIANEGYRKLAPDLERWALHVLEKQDLYSVELPRGSAPIAAAAPELSTACNWPPMFTPETANDTSSTVASQMSRILPVDELYVKSYTPRGPDLTEDAKQQLQRLGLNPAEEGVFRVGRVYGSTHGLCSNCDCDLSSEELVFRPQSMTPHQYQQLIDNGWYRRGGVKMFRLRSNHNVHCCDWETRVSAHKFDHRTHKSYKKVLKKMPLDRLTVETKPAHFCREAFDLYNEYHIQRHDKPRKSEFSYCEHIVNSPFQHQTIDGIEYGTYHQLYRLDGKLVAIGIIDVVPKGVVSIYMWYSVAKEVLKLSFGVYSALKEIEFVCELSKRNPSMQYYYLQGWNPSNKKLSYKANYEPEEFYCPCIVQGWVPTTEGVTRAKETLVCQQREEKGAGPMEESKEALPESTPTSEGQTASLAMETEENGSTRAQNGQQPSEDNDGGEVNQQADKKNEGSSTNQTEAKTPCAAFPHDKARYEAHSGQSTVDVSKIVVCLNHSEYMHLETLLSTFKPHPEQEALVRQRYSELLVALGPELASQLVVDLKACHCSSKRGEDEEEEGEGASGAERGASRDPENMQTEL